ncbi:MAG: anaerobic ribonucleoside-triphosphate reductase activating protein [Christensenellales bacterium]
MRKNILKEFHDYSSKQGCKDIQETEQNNDGKLLRIAGIMKESIVDGPGIRFAIFCQGCPHDCEGCHNPSTHSFQDGEIVKISNILKYIDENPLIQGVTFSGGEPLCQVKPFLSLAKEVKNRNLHLLIYTGYTIEELEIRMKKEHELEELLRTADHLIEGRFVQKLRNLSLLYRGSSNQRIIDLNAYFSTGEIIPCENITFNS